MEFKYLYKRIHKKIFYNTEIESENQILDRVFFILNKK